MKLVTARQMQELDRQTIKLDRVSQGTLMRRAGAAVAAAARQLIEPRSLVMVLAGRGKNGGDAIIAGNLLKRAGHRVDVLQFPLRRSPFRSRARADRIFDGVELVIDGLFGTGLSRPVKGDFKAAIEALGRARRRHPKLRVVSVDIPSGIHADTGRPMGCAVLADVTVTLGLPKLGLVQQPALEYVGRLEIADIGFSSSRVAATKTQIEYWTAAQSTPLLKPRGRGSFKNDYGHVLVAAGSVGLHGAAWICAHGALAAGAGLVTLAVPRSIYQIVASQCRQVMVAPVEDEGRGCFTPASWKDFSPLLSRKTALAVGPGIGRAAPTVHFLGQLTAAAKVPLILDADALTLAGAHPNILKRTRGPVVCTPHPGEMARLSGSNSRKVQANRIQVASRFARNRHVVVALKGARTVVADPTGAVSVNSTGNASLASGGTGDVLTGVVAGLLAQGMAPASSARLGVFLHGLAADRLSEDPVATGIKIEDLLREIPKTLRFLLKG